MSSHSAPAATSSLRTPPPPGRFARYFATRGWAHLVLLSGVGVFLFPFLWMLSTSLKTDEELAKVSLFPTLPSFVGLSPYLKPVTEVAAPPDVEPARWEAMLPRLRRLADARLAALQMAEPPSALTDHLDPESHRAAAVGLLLGRSLARLDRRFWRDDADGWESRLEAELLALMPPSQARSALADSVASLDFLQLQLRNLAGQVNAASDLVRDSPLWTVESGPGEIASVGGRTRLRYRFESASSPPVVLLARFSLPPRITPPGDEPSSLHKLILSLGCDNSFHRVRVEADIGPDRWTGQTDTYIAQHRPLSLVMQPPTFDDTTLRARLWVPLRKVGPARTAAASMDGPTPVALRVAIHPSSSVQAVIGKVQRNYLRTLRSVPFWTYVGNSLILVGLTMGGAMFSASFVAYAFARLRWPGRSIAFMLLLATMMLPHQVTMVPQFMIWRELGWYNTLNPLWVPAWFGAAFFIFLMTQHMKTIPRELEEAARIDGLNAVQTWWYIILPQVKPTLAAIAIMTFMGAWNEFMGPLIYLRDQDRFPLSLGLFGVRLDYGGDWTLIMAGNMLMTLPVILIFLVFQRFFVQGMTMTGVKG